LLIPYTGSVNYQFRILEGTKVAKLQSCKVAKQKGFSTENPGRFRAIKSNTMKNHL